MSQQRNVAVIGLGNIGKIVAANLVKGNRAVIVADRTLEKAHSLAMELGSLVKPAEIPAALREADIVVMAIYFDAIKDFFKQYASELKGKIIVDPSNPIAPAEGGGFKKIVGENESSGLLLSKLLPDGSRLAEALGTLGAATLESAAFQTPEKAVQFYTTDDSVINREIEELIRDNCFEPLRVGGLDQSVRIEVFGDLHEFGALGKAVTLEVAKQKV